MLAPASFGNASALRRIGQIRADFLVVRRPMLLVGNSLPRTLSVVRGIVVPIPVIATALSDRSCAGCRRPLRRSPFPPTSQVGDDVERSKCWRQWQRLLRRASSPRGPASAASRNAPPAPTIGSVHTRTARTRARSNGTNTTTRGQHENGFAVSMRPGANRQDHGPDTGCHTISSCAALCQRSPNVLTASPTEPLKPDTIRYRHWSAQGPLKAPAAPGRAGPATRQGRKHVGVYVPPDVAHRLRVLAAVESTSTQALIEQAIEMLFQSRAGAAR